LPGRVSTHARDDLQLLPSSTSKSEVFKLYDQAMVISGFRSIGQSTFRSLWLQLLPRIVLTRPMTDLCWVCQRNNREITMSSNLPEVIKATKLAKQQDHLANVKKERELYREEVNQCKESQQHHPQQLGKHTVCSNDLPAHYSFDFAQQVNIPYDPLQPGPMYFLCPRKVGPKLKL